MSTSKTLGFSASSVPRPGQHHERLGVTDTGDVPKLHGHSVKLRAGGLSTSDWHLPKGSQI